MDIYKLILKCIWRIKRPRIANTVLTNQVGKINSISRLNSIEWDTSRDSVHDYSVGGWGAAREKLAMLCLIRKVMNTVKAPAAISPYSQTVLVDRAIYILG